MDDLVPLTGQDRPLNPSTATHGLQPSRKSNAVVRHLANHLGGLRAVSQDVKFIARYIRCHSNHKIWIHITVFLLLVSALVSSGLVVLASTTGIESFNQYCNPGGSFNFAQEYNPWASEHTFQITLGFGRLTFTQAKAIDVVWDVVVGRGGQFLLAWICFHVFSKSLNQILEQPKASMSYDAFRAIVFERPSLTSTYKLAGDVTSTTGWRSKTSILWMVVASIYVVAFPTMISAMTGYSSNVDPYFNDGTGNGKVPIPNNYFHRVVYRITDADRIQGMQLNATYLVGRQGFGSGSSSVDFDYSYCLDHREEAFMKVSGDCALAIGITEYMKTYAPNTAFIVENTTLALPNGKNYTVVPDKTAQTPGLVVETFNTFAIGWSAYDNANLSTVNGSAPPVYTTTNGTELFNATYLNGNAGTCDSQTTYLWGFSFILLFGFFIITGIWALGMYAMWIDTLYNSRLNRAGRVMGFYRGMVDVSNAVWKDTLREPGELVPDSKIREMMAEKLNGGRITFDEVDRDNLPPTRKDDFRRATQNLPVVNGWTRTWTLLHWGLFLFFVFGGLAWFSVPLILFFGNRAAYRLLAVVSLTLTVVFWLITLVMLLAIVPGFVKVCHRATRLSLRLQLLKLAHWVWTILFAAAGGLSFCLALGTWAVGWKNLHLLPGRNVYFLWRMISIIDIIFFSFAMVVWTPAAIMFVIGVFSTLRRWSRWPTGAVSQRRQRHDPIPLTDVDTSYPTHSVDESEPEMNQLSVLELQHSNEASQRDFA